MPRRCTALLILLAACLLLFADPASAQIDQLQINTGLDCAGGTGEGQSLFNNRSLESAACSTNAFDLFGKVMCNYENVLGTVMARIYCGVQLSYLNTFAGLLVLYIACMGVLFTIGVLEMTLKDLMIQVVKIGLVVTFAYNADFTLGVSYAFFTSVMRDATAMFSFGGAASVTAPDEMITSGWAWLTQPTGAPGCVGGIIGLFVAMLIFAPLLFLLIAFAFLNLLLAYIRALFAYLYALMMVTLLIALSPIFVSFALFDTTRQIFEQWVQYLISNVLQVIIVFAFVYFLSLVNFGVFIRDLYEMLRPWWMEVPLGPFRMKFPPFNWGCTICNVQGSAGNWTCGPSPYGPADIRGISPANIITRLGFLSWIVTHSVALLVLTAVLNQMMRYVPEMAQQLGGQRFSQVIGGGTRGRGGSPQGSRLKRTGLDSLENAPGAFLSGSLRYIQENRMMARRGGGTAQRAVTLRGMLGAGFQEARETYMEGISGARVDPREHALAKMRLDSATSTLKQARYTTETARQNLANIIAQRNAGKATSIEVSAAQTQLSRAEMDEMDAQGEFDQKQSAFDKVDARHGGLIGEMFDSTGEVRSVLTDIHTKYQQSTWYSLLQLNKTS